MSNLHEMSPHRQAPVPYRATAESIALAKADAATERAEYDRVVRAEELDRHAAIQVLTEMVERWGLESVERWVRNISAMTGGR